jgi:MoaA/NifB/PqqE/SkfB family radical SAM enzyme
MRGLQHPKFLMRLAETWFHRPAAPTRAVLELTRRCNLRCSMCHTWEIEPRHELSVDEVRRILGQMPHLKWLDLTGGELFQRKDIVELIEAVCALPALGVLHFPTNGWFTARILEAVDRVRALRPDLDLLITVSIDGPPALHDRIRGRDGCFERAIETFLRLRASDSAHVYLGTTIIPDNADAIDDLEVELRRRIPDFRADEWHWNWMQISEHFFHNGHLANGPRSATGQLVRRHIRRRGLPRNLVDLMELAFLVNLEFYQRGEPTGIVCQALRSTAFISPEGDLYPCHVYDRPLGNLRERSLRELWNSAEVRTARRDIEKLACGGCFTPCEAYPALAGAPVATAAHTGRRALRLLYEYVRDHPRTAPRIERRAASPNAPDLMSVVPSDRSSRRPQQDAASSARAGNSLRISHTAAHPEEAPSVEAPSRRMRSWHNGA